MGPFWAHGPRHMGQGTWTPKVFASGPLQPPKGFRKICFCWTLFLLGGRAFCFGLLCVDVFFGIHDICGKFGTQKQVMLRSWLILFVQVSPRQCFWTHDDDATRCDAMQLNANHQCKSITKTMQCNAKQEQRNAMQSNAKPCKTM